MATTAIIGTGLTLTHSGLTFPIISVDGPNITREKIEASKMSTTTWKDYLFASLKDPGDLTMTVEWNGALPTFATSPASTVITFSNSNTLTGTAVITSFEPSTPLEDKMTAQVTLSFSGAIT